MRRWRFEQGNRTVTVSALLAYVLPFAVYLLTLARDVTFIDSGELAAVAARLGIAHPSGYPLFTLLGHLFSLLPGGTAIFRIGLLSAVSGAAASGLLFRAAWSLVGEQTPPGPTRRLGAVGVLSGALLFPFALTPWSQAVIVEVYALQAAIVAAFVAVSLASVHRGRSEGLGLVGLLFGLSLANHLTGVLLLPAFLAVAVYAALDRRRAGESPWPAWLRLAWPAPLPLLLYVYLPLRSRMDPPINWDYPETWHRLLMHVSARQYQGHFGSQGMRWGELRRFFLDQFPGEASILLPLLAALGVCVLVRERPRALVLTAPVAAALVVYNMGYPIGDIQVYYLPVLAIFALWAASAGGWIGRQAGRLRVPAAAVAGILLGLAPVLPLVRNYERNDLSRYRDASAFVRDIIRYAEPRAVIFSGDGSRFTAPMSYLQLVENLRPDLVVLDLGRLASPTLERDLRRRLPEVVDACAEELKAGATLAWIAENGKDYDVEWGRSVYRTMQKALVRASMQVRPTYVLGGAFQHPMFVGAQRHPEGLLVRLDTDTAYRPFPVPAFELPARLAARPDDAEAQGLLAEYLSMLDGRVRYLGHHGRGAEADSVRALMARLGG